MEKAKILGGSSLPGSIKFVSDRFSSTVTYDRQEKTMSVKVVPKSAVSTLLSKLSNWPIPRTILFYARMFEGYSRRQSTILGIMILAMIVCPFVFPADPPTAPETDWGVSFWIMNGIGLCLMGIFLTIVTKYIATWHGAEHMAIASYERNESCDVNDIAQQGRVHPKCGGRMLAPIVVISILMTYFSSELVHIHVLLPLILIIEITFWYDKLIGWDKTPVFKQISELLQKYITTSQPGLLEITAASLAMQKLAEAHNGEVAPVTVFKLTPKVSAL